MAVESIIRHGSSTTGPLSRIGLALWWALYVLVYLSFVSPLTWPQLAAGAGLSAAAVWLTHLGMRAAGLGLTGAVPAVWRLGPVLRILGRELTAVASALTHQVEERIAVRGRFVLVSLEEDVGPALDAAITLEAAAAPNTFVVEISEDERLLLVHQLEPRPDVRRSFPRWAP